MKFRLPKFFNLQKTPYRQVDSPKRYFNYSGGTLVSPETALEVSAFYRGIVYISSQIAKLPWEVKDKNKAILWDDRVMQLLDLAPNDEMTSFNFKCFLVAQAIMKGNAYAEIERNIIGTPVALHLIPTESVLVQRRLVTGELVYKVVAGGWSGVDVYLKPSDVLHIRNLFTKDGIIGQGVIGYAVNTLGIALGADNFANSLFSNGGLPSGTLEVPGVLDDAAYERVKESWKEAHTGKKTGGIAILEEGVKFNPVAFSPDILQFLDSRKFSVVEIARFLGLPPTKLFDSNAAKYNNIEHSNLEVALDTLDAWAKNLEQEADIKLLNYRFGGKHSKIDLYAIFRGDMVARAEYFSKQLQSGAITPNEIREKEGMPSYADGNTFFISSNNLTPMDKLVELINSQIEKNKPVAPVAPDNTPSQSDTAMNEAITKFLASRTKQLDEK